MNKLLLEEKIKIVKLYTLHNENAKKWQKADGGHFKDQLSYRRKIFTIINFLFLALAH